jgi:hypothetical protein
MKGKIGEKTNTKNKTTKNGIFGRPLFIFFGNFLVGLILGLY